VASSLVDRIEADLNHIKALEPERQRTAIAELVELKRSLDDSLSTANQEDLSRLAELKNRLAVLASPLVEALGSACLVRVRDLQEALPHAQSLADVEAAEAHLAQANQEWEWMAALRREHVSSPSMRALRDQIAALTRRMGSVRRFVEVRNQVSSLAERAAGLEETLPDDALVLAKDAATTANAALNSGFEWNDLERDALRLLWGERQRAYDDLRLRHEVPVTKSQGDELVYLIIGWSDRATKDPSQLVTYFTSDEPGAPTGVMSVQKALDVARQKLVRELWRNKLEEYIRAADARLQEHRPREALAELKRWQELPGLHDERVGVKVPDNLTVRVKQAEDRIKPELQAFEAAEEAVLRARIELQSDAVAAYRSWQTANAAYPYVAELQSLLLEIQQKARNEAVSLLDELRKSLTAEEWGLCEMRFNRLDALLALDANLRSELQGQRDRYRAIYDHVAPLLPGKPRLSFRDELALLRELANEYPEYWEGWLRLAGRLATLEARSNVQDMATEAQALCRPDVMLGQLEAVYFESVRLQQDPPEGLSPQDERQLNQLVLRLKSWLGYARARDVIEQAEAAPASDPDASALDALFAPDLSEASRGIAEAAGDLPANQAVGERNLRRRLQRLIQNDAPVQKLLSKAPAVLASGTLADGRALLAGVNEWLMRPNSYRAELLALKQTVQRWLAERLAAEVEAVLATERTTRFSRAGIANKLETYLVELSAFPPQMRPAEVLLETLNAAERIANAHLLQRSATEGHASWEEARSAWDLAAQAARRDADLVAFCHSQVRNCYREQALVNARRAGSPAAAERILAAVVIDEAFRSDWYLLLQHGRYALLAAQDMLRDQSRAVNDQAATSKLALARESLNRAQSAIMASGTDVNAAMEIKATLAAIATWETLARGKVAITEALPVGGPQLRSDQCRTAITRYQETLRALNPSEPRQLLQSFWDYQRNEARSALERQLKKAADERADELDKVDMLLGTTLLFPEDDTLVKRLVGLVTEALRITKQEVAEVSFDASAGRFLARYARQQRGAPPPDRLLVGQQLADVTQVVARVDMMKHVLDIVRQHVGQGSGIGSLEDEEKDLNDWVGQLNQLSSAQGQVTQLVTFGLKEPEKFAAARYILWLGGETLEYQQVPPTFRDAGHPTYHWLLDLVSTAERRRANQERYRRQIELALKYEQADSPDSLPASPSPSESDVVAELKQILSQPIRRYPLEHVLELIDRMGQEEPEDPCGLQSTMEYHDPDDPTRVHRSLPLIKAAVQRKVDQVRVLRRWLSQFSFGSAVVPSECPGIVDWPKARASIVSLRDRDPEGLKASLTECRRVEKGDERELYRGMWSLQRAYRALAYDAMVATLRNAVGDTGLCSAATSLNHQRDSLYQEIAGQIAQCQELGRDIEQRIKGFEPTWKEVQASWNALVSQHKFSSAGPAADRFRVAATEFARICPNWGEFQKILRTARHKGLHHEALREDWLR
jgi:hypothetical protein